MSGLNSKIKFLSRLGLSPDDLALIARSNSIAQRGHGGQIRILSGRPFIVHPRGAGSLLAEFRFGAVEISAGLLHDTPEENPRWDFARMQRNLRHPQAGRVVAIVRAMTYDRIKRAKRRRSSMNSPDANARMASCRLVIEVPGGAAVSLADSTDNMLDINHFLAKGVAVYSPARLNRDPAEELRFWRWYETLMRGQVGKDPALAPLFGRFLETFAAYQRLLA